MFVVPVMDMALLCFRIKGMCSVFLQIIVTTNLIHLCYASSETIRACIHMNAHERERERESSHTKEKSHYLPLPEVLSLSVALAHLICGTKTKKGNYSPWFPSIANQINFMVQSQVLSLPVKWGRRQKVNNTCHSPPHTHTKLSVGGGILHLVFTPHNTQHAWFTIRLHPWHSDGSWAHNDNLRLNGCCSGSRYEFFCPALV